MGSVMGLISGADKRVIDQTISKPPEAHENNQTFLVFPQFPGSLVPTIDAESPENGSFCTGLFSKRCFFIDYLVGRLQVAFFHHGGGARKCPMALECLDGPFSLLCSLVGLLSSPKPFLESHVVVKGRRHYPTGLTMGNQDSSPNHLTVPLCANRSSSVNFSLFSILP